MASLATALVLGASLAGAGSASAQPGFEFDRVAGIDRYETAARAAQRYWDGWDSYQNTVIVANGEPGHYADALSANYLAGCLNAPILLTHTNVTPQFTLNKLQDLSDDSDGFDIIIVGGTGVVSAAQRNALDGEGWDDDSVTRIGGADRFATNANVINSDFCDDSDDVGVIATGMDFPDALGAGPVAYEGHALGLSRTNSIDDGVVNALVNNGVDSVIVLGGESVVGHEVVTRLDDAGIDFEQRIAGTDRSGTSTELADYAMENFGFSNWRANVASGYPAGGGADALGGGPMTGGGWYYPHPMLITRDVNNPGAVTPWLEDNAYNLGNGDRHSFIFGGPVAVSLDAEQVMENAAKFG